MHELHELKEKLIRELADYGKNELSTGSLEIIDKLAHAAKNVCKLMEDGQSNRSYGRSYDGSNRSYDGAYDGSYDGSYDGESNRRGRGRYARRDSMGRYADAGLAKELKELMEDAPEDSKQDFKRLIQKIEMM